MEKNRRVGVKEVLGRGIVAGAIFFGANFGLVSGKHFSENPNPSKESTVKKYQIGTLGFILEWEGRHLLNNLGKIFNKEDNLSLQEEEEEIDSFFGGDKASKGKAEKSLERRINQVFHEEGFHLIFPADIEITKPLNIVGIASDDRIEIMNWILMRGGISEEEKGKIEDEIESSSNNTSALVVPNGGVGFVYPTLVAEGASREFTEDVAIEETFHVNSGLTKLGINHGLDISGIRKNEEAYVLGENAVNVVAKEISNKLKQKFGKEKVIYAKTTQKSPSTFDYPAKVKNLRRDVEKLLEKGQKEEASLLMEETRLELNKRGYNIRKINIAWIAIYGAYPDGPSPLVDNVRSAWEMMMELRELSSSLKEFWDVASGITSFKELDEVLSKKRRVLEMAS